MAFEVETAPARLIALCRTTPVTASNPGATGVPETSTYRKPWKVKFGVQVSSSSERFV